MSLLILGRGNARLGWVERDADGNETKRVNAHWEESPEGGSVAIGMVDPDTMEPMGPADIVGDWDAAGYLAKVLELLGPGRPINIPDMAAIIKGAIREGFDPCDHCCGAGPCRDCIVREWREDVENE